MERSRAELVQLLAERLRRLTEDLPLLRVVLFGSYAKGNYTAGSDVDLVNVPTRRCSLPPHPVPLPRKEKVKSWGRGNDLKFSLLPTRGEGEDEGGR